MGNSCSANIFPSIVRLTAEGHRICRVPNFGYLDHRTLGRAREAHADKQSRLCDAVMGIAQDTNGTGLHHHGELKSHGKLQPSLCEGTEDMAVCHLSWKLLVDVPNISAGEEFCCTTKTSGAVPPLRNGSCIF